MQSGQIEQRVLSKVSSWMLVFSTVLLHPWQMVSEGLHSEDKKHLKRYKRECSKSWSCFFFLFVATSFNWKQRLPRPVMIIFLKYKILFWALKNIFQIDPMISFFEGKWLPFWIEHVTYLLTNPLKVGIQKASDHTDWQQNNDWH